MRESYGKHTGNKFCAYSIEKGFSLVELLIVVAIIAIIVAIAVPNFLVARKSAQASSMMGDLRTILTAETAYYIGPGKSTYGNFIALETHQFLPSNLSSGATSYNRYGYTGTLTLTNNDASFSMHVDSIPITNISPSFFIDESGLIRYNTATSATATDPPVGT